MAFVDLKLLPILPAWSVVGKTAFIIRGQLKDWQTYDAVGEVVGVEAGMIEVRLDGAFGEVVKCNTFNIVSVCDPEDVPDVVAANSLFKRQYKNLAGDARDRLNELISGISVPA